MMNLTIAGIEHSQAQVELQEYQWQGAERRTRNLQNPHLAGGGVGEERRAQGHQCRSASLLDALQMHCACLDCCKGLHMTLLLSMALQQAVRC